jgi:hypothetical protein
VEDTRGDERVLRHEGVQGSRVRLVEIGHPFCGLSVAHVKRELTGNGEVALRQKDGQGAPNVAWVQCEK